jgi:formate hydrogenlyase subunit 6/NADH:ubiquinone oxidoreductase subunit I
MGLFTIKNFLFRYLFGRPATEKYPFGPKEFVPKSRGRIVIVIEDCIFCGVCSRKCPTGAITVKKNEKRWAIDRLKCITCNACVELCPKKCLMMESRYSEPMLDRKEEIFSSA